MLTGQHQTALLVRVEGVPLNSTASATRVSPTSNGSEFDILDSNGNITSRVWSIPAGDVLSAAQQATGFADMDNVMNSQVCLNSDFYNTQGTSDDGVAGYDATSQTAARECVRA